MSYGIVPRVFTRHVAWLLGAAVGAMLASCGPSQREAPDEPATPLDVTGVQAEIATNTDWAFYRGDVLGHSYVDQPLTVAEASGFSVAWTRSGAGSVANPIVVAGTAYIAGTDGRLVALDAATGRQLWSQSIGTAPATFCHPWVNGPVGAPAVVGNTVFAPGGDGAVHAFAKDTGTPLWSTPVANLSADGTAADDFLWSSAFPLHGRIYVGLGTLGENRCGPTPGRVVVLDQSTGAVVGTWWVDPQRRDGATIWTQPTYDAATNRLFFTTGQGDPALPLSSQPTAQAFVAIDADTLQPLDWLQPVSAPSSADYDFGASPTLVDLPDGRRLIVAANKDGYVYAANRNDLRAGVVWSYRVSLPGDSPDVGASTIVGAAYAKGRLFVGGGETPDGFQGSVVALDPATGTKQWVFHPDGFVLASLLVVGDAVVVQANHLPDYTGRLYVLDQATGTPVFQMSTPGRLYAQATFAAGKLFVADLSGVLYAFTPPSVTQPTAATPVFTPAGGTYTTSQSVTISDATPGAAIYYTLDGSTPTTTSTRYTAPIPVATTTTLRAIATASGFTNSAVASATYTIQSSTPPGPQVLLADEFSRTSGLGASWVTWFGSHSTDGANAVSGPAPIQGNWASVAQSLGTNDYVVTATISIPPGSLYSGVVARGNPGNFTGDLYAAQIATNGTVNLYRRNQWTWTLLRSVAAGITSGPFYTLQLAVTGASPVHLEVSLGGTKLFTVDDSSAARISSGVPGIQNYNAGVKYGRFEVAGSGGVTPQPTVATPAFTPPGGTYTTSQSVTISDATPGAAIFYTLDGSTPTTTSTRYTAPIPVATTTTLRAIATASGFTNSAVASATYTIQSSTPPGPQVLFADEFSRTSGLGASWVTWFGSYSTDGANAVSGPAPIQGNWASVAQSLGTNDYVVTATISIPPGSLYSGVVARGNPGNFTGDLYAAQIATNGTVNLYRRNQWTWTLLRSVAAGITSGPFYTLQLAVTGSSPVHLEVSLGGTKLITVDDSSGARISSGVPGIENYNAGVKYGRVEVAGR